MFFLSIQLRFMGHLPTIAFIFNLKSVKIKFDTVAFAGHDNPFTLHLVIIVIVTMFRVRKQTLVCILGNQHSSTYCNMKKYHKYKIECFQNIWL